MPRPHPHRLAGLCLLLIACESGGGATRSVDAGRSSEDDAGDSRADASVASGFTWALPPGFPRPIIPDDNPMTDAKVELGRRLFYDKQLSGNRTQSCATCHQQAKAFTDGRAVGLGSTGEMHSRGPMSLANAAYASSLTWGNPLMRALERQATVPEFGDSPFELALPSQGELESRLRADAKYRDMFADAFPDAADPITAHDANLAIASFERVLISGRSPFDRWLNEGDAKAISDSAKRGYELFNSEQLECFHCHGGFAFTDHVAWEGEPLAEAPYHNTGLYNVDGKGAYPEPNTGVYSVTLDPNDMGKFKAPTLRNIAMTAPYMHDGSIATLSEVLDHYAAGGRTITSGSNKGIGSKNPLKDPLVQGFSLSDQQRADLIAFLESLTDQAFLSDPAFADPFTGEDERDFL
jgi:cytochrome c peroxidase